MEAPLKSLSFATRQVSVLTQVTRTENILAYIYIYIYTNTHAQLQSGVILIKNHSVSCNG